MREEIIKVFNFEISVTKAIYHDKIQEAIRECIAHIPAPPEKLVFASDAFEHLQNVLLAIKQAAGANRLPAEWIKDSVISATIKPADILLALSHVRQYTGLNSVETKG